MPQTFSVTSPAMPTLLGVPALEFNAMYGEEAMSKLYNYRITLVTPDAPALSEITAAQVDVKALIGKSLTVHIELDGKGLDIGQYAKQANEVIKKASLVLEVANKLGDSSRISKAQATLEKAQTIAAQAGSMGSSATLGKGKREISGLVTQARFLRVENRRAYYEVVIEPWLTLATRTNDYKIYQNKDVITIIREVLSDYNYPSVFNTHESYPERVFQVQYGETDYDFIQRLMHEWGLYFYFEHKDGAHRFVIVDSIGSHKPSESSAYQTIAYYSNAGGHKINEEHINEFNRDERLQTGQWVTNDFDFTQPTANLQQQHAMPRKTGHANMEMYQWPGDYENPDEGKKLAQVKMEATGSEGSRAYGAGNLRGIVTGQTFKLSGYPQEKANREYLILSATLDVKETEQSSGGQEYECRTRFELQPTNKIYRANQAINKPKTSGPQTATVTGPAGQELHTDNYGRVKVKFHWDRYNAPDENSSCWVRVSYPLSGSGFGMVNVPRIGQEVIVDFENGDPDKPLITGRVFNADNMPPWPLPASANQMGLRSNSLNKTGGFNALRMDDTDGAEEFMLQAQKDMNSLIKNNEKHTVDVNRTRKVGGKEAVTVKGARRHSVGNGERISVKNGQVTSIKGNMGIGVKGKQSTKVSGTITTQAGGKITIASGEDEILVASPTKITLGVGSSVIVLTPDGILLSGPIIDLNP